MMTTIINFDDDQNEVLKDEEDEIFDFDNISLQNLRQYIIDFSISQDVRIQLLNKFYKNNFDETIEIISLLSGRYQFSGTILLENYLFDIATKSELCSFLKLEATKSLLSFGEPLETIKENDDEKLKEVKSESNKQVEEKNKTRSDRAYFALNHVCYTMDEEITTTCRIEAICMLMICDNYFEDSINYFVQVINNKNLECDFRYKAILSLEKKDIPLYKKYIKIACKEFLFLPRNFTRYRILSGQYLLQHCELEEDELTQVEECILEFAQDNDLDFNLRADAADTLLNVSKNKKVLDICRDIIILLGNIHGKSKTVFENAQNVHTKEIERSVLEIVQTLTMFPTLKIDDNFINFEYVNGQVLNMIPNKCITGDEKCLSINEESREYCSQECEKINITNNRIKQSMNRIDMDRTLYSNHTISNVLVKVWSYVQNNEHKEEMIKRLLQELDDMCGTCSSGFIGRLVNTLSGFGDLNISISFDDQIVSNFCGRLNVFAQKITNSDSIFFNSKLNDVLELYFNHYNLYPKLILHKRIECMKDEFQDDYYAKIVTIIDEFSEAVINEMTVSSSDYKRRQSFLLFFRTYMPDLREELYTEFKDYVTDSEFDLSIRKAISVYDGVRDVIF